MHQEAGTDRLGASPVRRPSVHQSRQTRLVGVWESLGRGTHLMPSIRGSPSSRAGTANKAMI